MITGHTCDFLLHFALRVGSHFLNQSVEVKNILDSVKKKKDDLFLNCLKCLILMETSLKGGPKISPFENHYFLAVT